jgi:hypothetical protein
MINVVTVHWRSTRWIEPQLRYLERNLGQPYRVFASLNGIEDEAIRARFHVALDLPGTHAEKLNELAGIVRLEAAPEEGLLFLDGDAFPVRPCGQWLDRLVASHPLAAVRRDENLGDQQPHPCFCLTTVGFWSQIDGDWREGGTWVNAAGQTTTDVGGTLLHQLADRGIEWRPLLRTNTHNPDPLWFGVYDHRIYHHGAGFRTRTSRLSWEHEAEARQRETVPLRGSSLEGLAIRAVREPGRLANLRPEHLELIRRGARISVAKQRRAWSLRQRARLAARNDRLEGAIYGQLLDDPGFFRQFDAGLAE